MSRFHKNFVARCLSPWLGFLLADTLYISGSRITSNLSVISQVKTIVGRDCGVYSKNSVTCHGAAPERSSMSVIAL